MVKEITILPVNGMVITKSYINDCALLSDSEFRHLTTALQAFATKGVVVRKQDASVLYNSIFETYINKLYVNKVKLAFKHFKKLDEPTEERIILATSWWPEEAYEVDDIEELDEDEIGYWMNDCYSFITETKCWSDNVSSAESFLNALEAYKDVYDEFEMKYSEEYYNECVTALEDLIEISEILTNCREHYSEDEINEFIRTLDFSDYF